MPEPVGQAALLKLLTWLSPAFPVGAFAYSHGLERAIHDGVIDSRESLLGWLTDLVERGSGWNDAVLLAASWRGKDVADLAEAMAGSRERHMETTLQGEAFGRAIGDWERQRFTLPPSVLPDISPSRGEIGHSQTSERVISPLEGEMSGRTEGGACAYPSASYPVAVGLAAAMHGVLLEDTLVAYLHAFTSNLVQAAVRLVPLGQRDGVMAVAALEPVLFETASRAASSTLDDLGSSTFLSEIAAMRHEIQYSRVFRS